MKKRGKTLRGMWETLKEQGKKSWLAKNWKMIAGVLFFLFAPLKWIKKLWDWVKVAWDFSKDHPLIAAVIALGAIILGPLNIIKFGLKSVWKLLKGIPGFLTKLPGYLGTAVGKMKKWGKAGVEGVKSVGSKIATGARAAGGAIKTGAIRAVEGAKAGAKAVGGKIGDMASSTKGIFGSLVKKFGSAGKWIMKLGSKLIMPLVTTPVGWAILAGLAIGGLAYVFWDDIKAIWEKSVAFISQTFSKVAEFASSMVGGARTMLGNFLRSVGAGMIADWIDPDGADKSKPAKEFTFGNFMGELWNIYTGIWKKVLDLVKGALKGVGKFAAFVARKMGFEKIANYIEEKVADEPEGETAEGETAKESKAAKAWRQKSKGKNIVEFAKERKEEYGDETWEETVKAHKEYKKSLTSDGPEVTKPPISDFKLPDYGKTITATSDRGLERQAAQAAKRIRKDVLAGKLPFGRAKEALENLGMPDNFVKTEMNWITRQVGQQGLIPQQSPDDKMNVMNNVNKENQALQTQQASSGPSQINVNSTTTNQSSSAGDVNTFAQAGAHPNKTLRTSMLK